MFSAGFWWRAWRSRGSNPAPSPVGNKAVGLGRGIHLGGAEEIAWLKIEHRPSKAIPPWTNGQVVQGPPALTMKQEGS